MVSYVYDTWGKLISTTGSSASTVGVTNPYRYRGYRYDTETGLFYVGSRYYDPSIGRFINADDTDILDGGNDHMLENNLFAYCLNNPVNMTDEGGYWPSWATKVLIGVAVIAVCAAITVGTGGAGAGVAGFIAAQALNGALIGAASGAVIGAGAGAVNHRLSTGSWKGAGNAALNGGANGFMTGAITGAVTGAISGGVKVAQAAKSFDKGTFKSGYQAMKYHYDKHVVKEGLSKGNNIVKYSKDATSFANRNASMLKYSYNYKFNNASWNSSYTSGQGGMFTSSGKTLTFWYR